MPIPQRDTYEYHKSRTEIRERIVEQIDIPSTDQRLLRRMGLAAEEALAGKELPLKAQKKIREIQRRHAERKNNA